MKYSNKFTLELKMKEFYLLSIPLEKNKKLLYGAIKNELYQAWYGITSGDWGGSALDWKAGVYYNLYKDGYIIQTELSKDIYGDFSKYNNQNDKNGN